MMVISWLSMYVKTSDCTLSKFAVEYQLYINKVKTFVCTKNTPKFSSDIKFKY